MYDTFEGGYDIPRMMRAVRHICSKLPGKLGKAGADHASGEVVRTVAVDFLRGGGLHSEKETEQYISSSLRWATGLRTAVKGPSVPSLPLIGD